MVTVYSGTRRMSHSNLSERNTCQMVLCVPFRLACLNKFCTWGIPTILSRSTFCVCTLYPQWGAASLNSLILSPSLKPLLLLFCYAGSWCELWKELWGNPKVNCLYIRSEYHTRVNQRGIQSLWEIVIVIDRAMWRGNGCGWVCPHMWAAQGTSSLLI